jgi:predicted lipoprotein with Yx(FWY)xxD motif
MSAADNQSERSLRPRRPALVACAAVLTVVFASTLAAIALAAATNTVSSKSNAKLGETLVVDAHGETLYALSPETSSHLLCKSSECLKFWPPLTVHSRKTKLNTGSGVHGHLAILRRSNGTLQVTLAGLPLYRYSGDRTKGQANGEGIQSFGGTWHVVKSTAKVSPSTPTTTAPTTPTTPATPPTTEPGYGY